VSLERLLHTLLFEGYALYPYRESAVKNRMRFIFGTLFPKTYAARAAEAFDLRLEVPVAGPPEARLSVELACLEIASEVLERRISIASGSLEELRSERSVELRAGALRARATLQLLQANDGVAVLCLTLENRSELGATDRETAVGEARAALQGTTDEFLTTPWKLQVAGQTVQEAPRHVMIRDTFSHLAHHRGQMTVYLRLMGAKVPALFGPSADDQSFS